jgi:hypothetical protein
MNKLYVLLALAACSPCFAQLARLGTIPRDAMIETNGVGKAAFDNSTNKLWSAVNSSGGGAPVDLSAYIRHDAPPPRTAIGWALQIPLADGKGIAVFEAGGLHLYGSAHASKYLADKITHQENSYFFPAGSGTLALKSDIDAGIAKALADFDPGGGSGWDGTFPDLGTNFIHKIIVSNFNFIVISEKQ